MDSIIAVLVCLFVFCIYLVFCLFVCVLCLVFSLFVFCVLCFVCLFVCVVGSRRFKQCLLPYVHLNCSLRSTWHGWMAGRFA